MFHEMIINTNIFQRICFLLYEPSWIFFIVPSSFVFKTFQTTFIYSYVYILIKSILILIVKKKQGNNMSVKSMIEMKYQTCERNFFIILFYFKQNRSLLQCMYINC